MMLEGVETNKQKGMGKKVMQQDATRWNSGSRRNTRFKINSIFYKMQTVQFYFIDFQMTNRTIMVRKFEN